MASSDEKMLANKKTKFPWGDRRKCAILIIIGGWLFGFFLKYESVDKKVFYVPAFFIKNTADFGDIGLIYMKNNVSLKSDPPKNIPIFPADRGFKEASAYPRLYLQQELSKKKKGGTIDINVTIKNYSVVLIPFYCSDHGYYDSILLLKYPCGALI